MEWFTFRVRRGRKERNWSPCKKQELIDRLAEYEDAGLDPEEVRDLKRRDTAAGTRQDADPERILSRCPVCGHIYRIAYSDGLVAGEIPAFCQDCGQRLKRDGNREKGWIDNFMNKFMRKE